MNPVLLNEQDPSQLRWFALWRPQFAEFEKAQCIESLLGFRNQSEVLSGSSLPEDVQAVYLTENAERFLGVHPLLGRMIEPSDAAAGGQPVAVLNYRFWQRHFQGARDVIGKTPQYNIRTRGNPLSYMHALRSAVAAVAPDQQISKGADTLESVLSTDPQWSRQRLFSVLFGCFSAMALLLALVGLFSVVSFGVARRRTEFGIRMALGAPRRHIVWAAVRAALLSATLGIAFGVAIDLLLRGILSNWMKNQSSGFVGLFAVILLFAFSTVAACLLPASRAVPIDPVDALRNE